MRVHASLDTFGPTVIPKHSWHPAAVAVLQFQVPRGFLGVSKTVVNGKASERKSVPALISKTKSGYR
jgi:hypothetical protein